MKLNSDNALSLRVIALALVPISGYAEEPPIPEREKFGYDFASRLADTPLPFTNDDSALSVDLQPKLEDFLNEPYVRLPIEITYSSTAKREINLGFIPYFENPFSGDPESSDGYLTFGVKQRGNDNPEEGFNFAAGLDARIPLEEIPTDSVRESFDSYIPYLTTAYRLDDESKWLAFTTVQYHIVGSDRRHIKDPISRPRDLLSLEPGVIYQPGDTLRYSIRLAYRTDRLDGGADSGLRVLPSVTWYPTSNTPFFRRIAGHFALSLEFEYVLSKLEEHEEDDTFGVSLQVRWRFLERKPSMEDNVL